MDLKDLRITPEIHEWMKDRLWSSVDALYDDPHGTVYDPEDEDRVEHQVRDYYTLLRQIAKALEVDFDALVKENATDYEQERINTMLANTGLKVGMIWPGFEKARGKDE